MSAQRFWWLVEVDINDPVAKEIWNTLITMKPAHGIRIGRSALPDYYNLTLKDTEEEEEE
jgi:hypothetical protein